MKFWFGKKGWGWRLWGVSHRDLWFFGFSISTGLPVAPEDVAEGDSLPTSVQCTLCKAITNSGNGCYAEGCPVGRDAKEDAA